MSDKKLKIIKKTDKQHPQNIAEDLRRLEISQLEILAKKLPKEFKRIADKIQVEAA